jgi:hypothetical protein
MQLAVLSESGRHPIIGSAGLMEMESWNQRKGMLHFPNWPIHLFTTTPALVTHKVTYNLKIVCIYLKVLWYIIMYGYFYILSQNLKF